MVINGDMQIFPPRSRGVARFRVPPGHPMPGLRKLPWCLYVHVNDLARCARSYCDTMETPSGKWPEGPEVRAHCGRRDAKLGRNPLSGLPLEPQGLRSGQECAPGYGGADYGVRRTNPTGKQHPFGRKHAIHLWRVVVETPKATGVCPSSSTRHTGSPRLYGTSILVNAYSVYTQSRDLALRSGLSALIYPRGRETPVASKANVKPKPTARGQIRTSKNKKAYSFVTGRSVMVFCEVSYCSEKK